MCGRYRLTAKERYLRDHLGLQEDPNWSPHWNIAPTQSVPIVRQHPTEPRRTFGLVRWGLIPQWAKDSSIGVKTINARSETASETAAFRDAIRKHRCLVPADAFYEWARIGPKEKQPYNIGMADGSMFAFAGLWDRWRDGGGEVIETCTILTTEPNALVREVHNRMPVILRIDDYDLWLDPGVVDPRLVAGCLQPFDARLMRKYPVSTRVNRPENDDPECAQEIVINRDAQSLGLF